MSLHLSTHGTARAGRRHLARALVLAVALTTVAGFTATVATAAPTAGTNATNPDFGPNVTVFDPTMPVDQIQAKLDATYAKQVDNEMGPDRYAFLFKPGTYGTATKPLQIKVGYYTEIAGLGASPKDVTINGKVEVYNRCLADNGTSNCLALTNFWRTLSNLAIRINSTGQDGCRASANFWAVSQAVSMRRLDVSGGPLSLMDYCTAGPQFASGGFIADSKLPAVTNGSQQQWYTRNSEVAGWTNAVWNQVFSGTTGAPAEAGFPNPPYTTLATTPVSREKPYLFVDAQGRYAVRVPSARRNSSGTSWSGGVTPGRTIPLEDFYVAKPGDSIQDINHELNHDKHLLLTPGMYDVARSIEVKRADTVVLGLGHATLTAVDGAIPLTVDDEPGVVVAGVTVDAGTQKSPVLLQVGKKHGDDDSGKGKDAGKKDDSGKGGRDKSDPANPTTLSDVYFRVGGPHVGKADVSLQVNSDNVLIDHTWVWRADHGLEGFTRGVNGDTDRWNTNLGRNGVVVNGDHVTATGLFVEHYQQHNVVWNGEDGTTVFFQNELPYDPPTQADWGHDGVEGWAAYKVADDVRTHHLYGGGSYVFNQNNPSIHTENGFEVPKTPGVQLHHILTVNLSAGTLDHVVNGIGAAADTTKVGAPVFVTDYPAR
jgi:hypothetical protein